MRQEHVPAQHFRDDCIRIMSRLNHDLRSRIEQQSTYSSLSIAAPRDPAALMDLIETVMRHGWWRINIRLAEQTEEEKAANNKQKALAQKLRLDGQTEEEKAARLQYDRNCLGFRVRVRVTCILPCLSDTQKRWTTKKMDNVGRCLRGKRIQRLNRDPA